ncbi:MAG: CRTAC1 family protein [Verrucomicrobia bacterium]|nr:CRTAC1 family protein [Verrucomicrobiota bacterium]
MNSRCGGSGVGVTVTGRCMVSPTRTGVVGQLLFVLLASFCGCQRNPAPSVGGGTSPAASRFFEEITGQVGLRFLHDSGATGQYFMPEHVGSGAALFDFDNDGRLDVYLIQCGGPAAKSRNQLYHQQPDGTFRNVSEGSGVDVAGYGMGVAVGDINNDGLTDLLLTEYGAVRLFINLGAGKFGDGTVAAGLDNPRWATAAAFFDFDRDGWLDLVVANYVDYNPTQKCFDPAGVPEYCGPQNFDGTVARLFRNLGRTGASAAFEDVTVRSGLARTTGPALGLLCADFDGDRWPDIFIADDGQPNRLYLNQRNGTFAEEAALRGLAYNAMGETAGNMGVGVGDVNGDGLFDLFVTHLVHEQHALWVQGPRGFFQDKAAELGLVNPAWRGTGFGTVLADFDLDGRLDLAFVNGLVRRGNHPGPRVEGLPSFWSAYAQRNQLFRGDTGNKFIDISQSNEAFCGRAAVGRGLACGDIDNDGDLDLLATTTSGPAQLFRNVAPRLGHWLMLRALDPALGGRDAYGAEIVVDAGGKRWRGLVQPSTSYLVSNDPRVHFGLGSVEKIDNIRVFWPDGSEEVFTGGAADREIRLQKGNGHKP